MKASQEIDPGTSRGTQQHQDSFDQYLNAMRRVQHMSTTSTDQDMQSPRQRHRRKEQAQTEIDDGFDGIGSNIADIGQTKRISTIASMVPDEIIYKYSDYSLRLYESALMFIDVSGFTDLSETYRKTGRGGASRLTQVMNSYIGAMVQEILTHNGDVIKFAGDAFLSMWKTSPAMTIQDVVHTAIDCGLVIQKSYGHHVTDVGITLKVKVAISVGLSCFTILGDEAMARQHYVVIGDPVWDVKTAQHMASAGEVLTTNKAWAHVNEQEYVTQPCGDGRHTKVLGIGVTWKRVEKVSDAVFKDLPAFSSASMATPMSLEDNKTFETETPETREFSLRPAIISALRSSWWPALRNFMLTPVLRAVDNDEPMDYLTEVRNVVIVFINIITKTITDHDLIDVVDNAYKLVCRITSESGGLVNKVLMFDKDTMLLVIFGLRGLKQKDETKKALLCASKVKNTLTDPNILSVSIGVTSGTTYCGVVGHVLRREYTVIGSAVNKAARLMMAYHDKVTCDKETFVSSKLGLDCFRLMEAISMKGIEKPGPIYEFNQSGWVEQTVIRRHPILCRDDELRQYSTILKASINQRDDRFKRAIAIIGPPLIGKRRLMEEFLSMTPTQMLLDTITLKKRDKVPFWLIRQVVNQVSRSSLVKNNLNPNTEQEAVENMIRLSIGSMSLRAVQIYALNVVFDCRLPLPENFIYTEDILNDHDVTEILEIIFKKNFPSLRVLPVIGGNNIDNQSWRVLLIMLETKHLFVILTIVDDILCETAKACLNNDMIVKMHLGGIDRLYHSALACQFLDVQAIPADLEKVIESASNGSPGWIQNFLISLIQHSMLTVVTVPRSEAVESGAVLPKIAGSQRDRIDNNIIPTSHRRSSLDNMYAVGDNDTIQMAVLKESYHFEDLKVDMSMDVIILKTYDSLNPFEKIVLKCGSALGDVFSRRMLLHLIQSESLRNVSEAVAKLFEIRVLECEGGDFTQDTSMVLVHPAPAALPTAQPPYCICLGTRQPHDCRDLPIYAFCGYMKFRHPLFRITTYHLLTEKQKHEMHSRALMYLERYTRRCFTCGAGCFSRLLGVQCDEGIAQESMALNRVREQIAALSAESRMRSESVHEEYAGFDYNEQHLEQTPHNSAKIDRIQKRVRSFSSLNLETCECMPILINVYSQGLEHVRSVGGCSKIIDTYLEYVDLSIMNLNLPRAFRLLFELEEYVEEKNKTCEKGECHIKWIKNFRLARILTRRGGCMFETGDYNEARKLLLQAMKLYYDPFPMNKVSAKLRDMKCSFQQMMALHVAPRYYVATETGFVGMYYDDICNTLNKLYRLFTVCNENENAALTAKWSLNYALKSHRNFRTLCVSFANIISVYRQKQKFSKCEKLENMAMEVCHRKRGQLDVTEVYAVCLLYTNIFLFYIECGKTLASMDFGLSVIPMITRFSDLTACQTTVMWLLKLLISDQRIDDMVTIMRQFFYMTDNYDLTAETWYYYFAVMIILDTGYCVESYGACERFYIQKGDAIINSKAPQAAWNFFVCMWLVTIRTGAWEKTMLWEDKIKEIIVRKPSKQEYSDMLLIRLVEGVLIMMAREIDNRNVQKKIQMEKTVLVLFKGISESCRHVAMHRPRYFLFKAYYYFLKGKISKAYRTLDKAAQQAKDQSIRTVAIWIEHTRKHFQGELNPQLVNYWSEHVEEDNLLDYRDFDTKQRQIVPYTLPLPKDVDKL